MRMFGLSMLCAVGFVWTAVVGAGSAAGAEGLVNVGAAFRADTPFPQFMPLWLEGWALAHEQGESLESLQAKNALGGYVHVCLQNSSSEPLAVSDVLLDGISLTQALAFAPEKTAGFFPASIRFAKLPKADFDRLMRAGEPLWWKVDPQTIAAGSFAELIVRLRTVPTGSSLPIRVVAGTASVDASVEVGREQPRAMAIRFSPAFDRAFLYVRHPKGPGTAPVQVRLDGQDVTARSAIASDGAVDVAPIVIRPASPLARGSFHVFEAAYADGSAARAGLRAYADDFVYGMWGYINEGKTDQERVDYFLNDMRKHNINTFMDSIPNEVRSYMETEKGWKQCQALGFRAFAKWPGKVRDPAYYFLMDEPDAHDFAVKDLAINERLGSLGQDLVRHSGKIRARDPQPPHLLNIDNTYKPANYYTYAQLGDVCCSDPYYQEQQKIVWNRRLAWLPGFLKPTYVLAASTICQSACAPKPLHIILNSVRHDPVKDPKIRPEDQETFRFATPQEKQVEAFYALAAGATAFSYWWYTPYGEFYGCGGSSPDAKALWREIGLLGAQIRTAGPLLVRGCPATVPVKASKYVWVRSLLAGTDALVLLIVNDNFGSDRAGTVYVPIEKAAVTVTPPAWLTPKDVFEVACEGPRDVRWKPDGKQVALDLGRVEMTRMIVIAADPQCRGQLRELYTKQFAANVRALLASEPKKPPAR